jgi:hypothetical protein
MTEQQQPDLDAVARAILDANHYYRLYRATVTQHWVLDPTAAPDQRTPVDP